MGVEERGVAGGDDDVGVGDEVQTAAGAAPVHGRDHRLPHLVVPRGEAQLGVARATRLLGHRLLVAAEGGDVEAGLEALALARVHDHPHRGIGVELAPRLLELGHHASVHRVADLGPVEHQPADRAPSLDDQPLVHVSARRTPVAASPGTP